MIIKAENPPLIQEKSWLREPHASGVSVLYVQRAVVFNENWVQLEDYGHEKGEIARLSTTDSGQKTITLNGTLNYAHGSNAPVFEQQFDQVRFYKASAVSATYNLEITSSITVDNTFTEIDFPSGVATDFGKLAWYDSVGATESTQSQSFSLAGLVLTAIKNLIDGAKALVHAEDNQVHPSSRIWTDDDWRRAANDALRDIETRVQMRPRYNSTTYTADGNEEKDLPADFLHEDLLMIGNAEYQFIEIREYRRRNSKRRLAAVTDTKLLLGGSPNTNETVTLYYYAMHSDISRNAEPADVPGFTTLAMKYFMCFHYMLAKGEHSEAERFFQLYEDQVRHIQDSNPMRLPDSFNFVGDRRQPADKFPWFDVELT